MSDIHRKAVAAHPELRRLIDLCATGDWSFHPVLVHGEVELLAGSRLWPLGWSDAIAIRDVGDARACRCDPAGGQVWSREGSLVEVIDGLLELPPPGTPGAPALVTGRPPKLWTP